MKYGLLENGVDSLKATYNILEKLPDLSDGIEHNVKDAVLSLNHGIEILFKVILKASNEYLVFIDLDKYMFAKEKLKTTGKLTVFDVSPNLKTISLLEAIRRAEFLCDMYIPVEFKTTIEFLSKIRNQIMHYELNMTVEETQALVLKLQVCYEAAIEFFIKFIANIQELLVDARFEMTIAEVFDEMAEIRAEMDYEDYRLGQYEDED